MKGQFTDKQEPIRLIAVVLTAISSSLLIMGSGSAIASCANVLISFFLLLFPESYIPLILASSVSRSISIFGFSATYYYLFILLIYVSIRSKFKFHIVFGKSSVLLLITLFCFFISSLLSETGSTSVVIRLLLMIVLCYFCASARIIRIDKSMYFIRETSLLILLVILAKMVFAPVPYIIEGARSSITLSTVAADMNPNQIAQFIAVILFISVASLRYKNKLVSIICIVISIILLFLFKSRTSLYAALAISSFYFLFVIGRAKPWCKILVLGLAASYVIFQLFSAIQLAPAEALTYSEEKEVGVASIVTSGGSGRIFTWGEVIAYIIPEHPLLGIGIGIENYEAYGLEHDCDNLYFDLLAGTGIIGFVFFFLFFISIIREINDVDTTSSEISKYLLLLLLCFGVGETVYDSFFMWSIVFLCLINLTSTSIPRESSIKAE